MNARQALLAAAVLAGISACGGSQPFTGSGSDVSVPGGPNDTEALLAFANAHGLVVDGMPSNLESTANGTPSSLEHTVRQALLNGGTPAEARPQPFSAREEEPAGSELTDLLPQHPEYEELRQWLAVYREVQERGGWPAVPADPGVSLSPGDTSALVIPLRARLAASVDPDEAELARRGGIDSIYDPDLDLAVRSAQTRFGLTVDGVVGRDTWSALAVPAATRAHALASSMEWFRWLPRDFGSELTLWVNLPTFELEAVAAYTTRLAMPVVVGARETPTVLMVDTLERVVTNPYWNVPTSIVIGELAPARRANPQHLSDRGYEVVGPDGTVVPDTRVDWERPEEWIGTFRVRQRPGPTNALGAIKFLFPNQDAIYMHDTPSKAAFERSSRAASHGCVRLSDPWALAEFLFEHDVFDANPEASRLVQAPETLEARRPVSVVFTYLTARADRGGGAPRFAPPLYEAWEAAAPLARADR